MKINSNYLNLKDSYLFGSISKKVDAFKEKNPLVEIYRLGISDVTLPLVPSVVCAMQKAVEEMSQEGTFHGYGPEQGYTFLIEAIKRYYEARGIKFDEREIFVSDGAKSDLANVMDIFDVRNKVILPDPVYPAYLDVNIMLGRDVRFVVGNKRNLFVPLPPKRGTADIVYICSPNNPTGSVYTKEQLKMWVDYARTNGAVIIFDAAYESYVQNPALPRSIFEIEGARECAIEICSLSKTAGFTGVRCGYTIVPKELLDGKANAFWNRRQTTKFNGVSYIVQCAAAEVFTTQGQYEIKKQVAYYMDNANIIHKALTDAGIWHTGGVNGPFVWMECPNRMASWEYFEKLLNEAHVIGTPGAGFGAHGEGYMRLTAFGNKEKITAAINRLCDYSAK